jgi:hypothetical protein
MARKVILFLFTMMSLAALMGWVVWNQELQYALPTPVPANFVDVRTGTHVNLEGLVPIQKDNYALLHFFNRECPCSRFNMNEMEDLAHVYRGRVDFFVVLQSDKEEDITAFHDRYEIDVPVILDRDGTIARECGIYSTPQAVLLDRTSALYFKGNYNNARFCTRKETKFVELALQHLVKDEPLPLSIVNAVNEPYGCSLPSDEAPDEKQVFTLF